MNTVTRLTQLAERLTSLELNEEDNQEILQSVRYLAQILVRTPCDFAAKLALGCAKSKKPYLTVTNLSEPCFLSGLTALHSPTQCAGGEPANTNRA